jgi:hypothetical protein
MAGLDDVLLLVLVFILIVAWTALTTGSGGSTMPVFVLVGGGYLLLNRQELAGALTEKFDGDANSVSSPQRLAGHVNSSSISPAQEKPPDSEVSPDYPGAIDAEPKTPQGSRRAPAGGDGYVPTDEPIQADEAMVRQIRARGEYPARQRVGVSGRADMVYRMTNQELDEAEKRVWWENTWD